MLVIFKPISFYDFRFLFVLGLLPGPHSKRFDRISETIEEEQRSQARHVDDVVPGASRTRRFGSAIRSSVFQRHHTSVSFFTLSTDDV